MNEINEQQIQDFCKSAERMCHFNKMPSLVAALKIIKQRQAELAAAEEEIKRLRDGKQLLIVRPRAIGKMTAMIKLLRPEVHVQETTCQVEKNQAVRFLQEALPHITCGNHFQNSLIDAIGIFLKETMPKHI